MPSNVDEMTNTMLRNLETKSGKNLDQWLKIVDQSGYSKHKAIIDYLKAEHGLTYGYANLIALKYKEAKEGAPPSEDSLKDQQYSGSKADLRPTSDAIIDAVMEFGEDVEIAPKKTYTSLRRNKQFGIVQPSTKTRIDIGSNL